MLKISSQFFIEEFVVLFNFILKSGVYPDAWRDNIIKPTYKGWGTQDPLNYRGKKFQVALVSFLVEFFLIGLINILKTVS